MEPQRSPPSTEFAERTWLVEGEAADVAELVRHLAALARRSGWEFGNAEFPAEALVSRTERAPSAAAPEAPPPGAAAGTKDAEAAAGKAVVPVRLVLRLRTRR
ncbi:MAG: hypothetical protein FJ265_22575 [Planctomycetes bacterium]|nr:hypothetical protein [Planctomycetota bacterium]